MNLNFWLGVYLNSDELLGLIISVLPFSSKTQQQTWWNSCKHVLLGRKQSFPIAQWGEKKFEIESEFISEVISKFVYANSFWQDILYPFNLYDHNKKYWNISWNTYLNARNSIKRIIQLYKMFSHIVAWLDESIFLISFVLTRTPESPGQTQKHNKTGLFFSLQP